MQPAGLGHLPPGLVSAAQLGQMHGEAEMRVRLGDLWRRLGHMLARLGRGHGECAVSALANPVAQGLQIELARLLLLRDLVGGRHVGFGIAVAEGFVGACRFRRAGEAALLVDPGGLRHVLEIVEVGQPVLAVDQRRVLRFRRFDPGLGGLRRVEGDGDDGEVRVFEIVEEGLPHGQINTTASPACPGRQ